MKISNYGDNGKRTSGLVVYFDDQELNLVRDKVGPGPYRIQHEAGIVTVEQCRKDEPWRNCCSPGQLPNGEKTLRQTKVDVKSSPTDLFGASPIPANAVAWDNGRLMIYLPEVKLEPYRPRNRATQVRQRERTTTSIGALPMQTAQMRQAPRVIDGEAYEVPPSNPKLEAAVWAAIFEHYNEGKGRYDDGYSDERIAKETHASVDYVRSKRRGAYGDMKEDPKVQEVLDKIEALKQSIESDGAVLRRNVETKVKAAEDSIKAYDEFRRISNTRIAALENSVNMMRMSPKFK